MIPFLKNLRVNKLKDKSYKLNSGMTYVELIVVLSIFSVMSSVAIFNYGDFQTKVDIKNLASDIALKIVEAQKSSLSGQLPPVTQSSTWKPSYGVYFNLGNDNGSFIYFTDLDTQNNLYEASDCPGLGECLNKINLTPQGYTISNLDVFYQSSPTANVLNDLTITFRRPNSGAIIKSTTSLNSNVDYVQITILSPKGATALIKVYPSGRVQIN